MRYYLRSTTFAFIFLVTCAIASGQVNRSTLTVTVTDTLGNLVVGSTVSIERNKEKPRTATTDGNGTATFRNIAAGIYKISVTSAGFEKYESESLEIGVGAAVIRSVALEISPIESEVNVDQNTSEDPQTAGTALVLNQNQIDALPEDEAALERALRALGQGVTGEDLPITVNGVQGGRLPPRASIQQVRINQNVYSAQFESTFGGGIEVITRSTADRFRGWVNYGFANSRFNTADPIVGRRVPFRSNGVHASLFGPLFSKKATFTISGAISDVVTSNTVDAQVLDGSLRPVELKVSVPSDQRSSQFDLFINADPTKKHKIFVSYGNNSSRGSGQNVGGLSLPSRENRSENSNHFSRFSNTFLISPSAVNILRGIMSYGSVNVFGGRDEYGLNVLDAFFGGGSQQANDNRTFRFEVFNDQTRTIGKYSFSIGGGLRHERRSQVSTSNFGGTYTFAGRNGPILDANNQPVIGSDGNILTTEINSLEAYRRTLLFRQQGLTPQQIRQLGGGATQFTISAGDPELKVSQTDVSLYFQNSYRLSETVAASFGLRYETQNNIASNTNFAPRFGIIWSPKFDEKKKNPIFALPRVSIGYGLFYSRFALNNQINALLASEIDRRQYLVTEASILDQFPSVPSVSSLESFALPRTRRQIDPEVDTPFQSLLGITITKRLPAKFGLSGSFTINRNLRQSVTRNINAPLAGTWDPLNPLAAVRPFGNVGNIYETRSIGRVETSRISVGLNFPQSQKLFANLRYSYARSKSDTVGGSGSPFDPYDFGRDFGPTAFDRQHSLFGYMFYTIGRGFSIGSDFSISSGQRFNITTGKDTNGDGSFSERPSYARDITRPGVVLTPYGYLDPNPAPGDELIPRNLGRGRSTFAFNSSLLKAFTFNEDKVNKKPPRQTLTITARASNLFNVINKGIPVGNMASPNFLRTVSTFDDGSFSTINGIRQVNFAGRSISFAISVGF